MLETNRFGRNIGDNTSNKKEFCEDENIELYQPLARNNNS